ncbi:MAG: hypothetical protein IH945_08930 [Armatimonadetes bacterium]|nr:hypothetical protein [Armatimonadota bacterium]
MLDAVQALGSGGLVDVQLDAMLAKTSQAANVKVVQALQDSERHLLDILA